MDHASPRLAENQLPQQIPMGMLLGRAKQSDSHPQMSQFLGRLIRSPGSLEEEKRVWGSQGEDRGWEFSSRREGQTFFFYTP